MKAQISRSSFDAGKRYSGIYQQMGRMLTDADWNELSDLHKHHLAEVLTDVIGSGTPRERGLVRTLHLPDGTRHHMLRWGVAYVDGILAAVAPHPEAILADPSVFDYDSQADFPNPPPLPVTDHQLYLDVWERTVLVLEDGELRDAGLHGADTCTRTQTMAQVKWCPLAADPLDPAQNPGIGEAQLTLEIRQGSTEPDPCDPCAEEIALQDKLGNYLFRVEVHHVEYDNGGKPDKVVLKWSRENGAEQYSIGEAPLGFESSAWVYEFFDGYVDPLAAVPELLDSEKHLGRHLTPGFTPIRGALTDGYPDSIPSGYSAVRRWDGYCTLQKVGANWQLIEGADRGVVLSTTSDANAHAHVSEGATVTINHDVMTLTLELDDHPLLAGDFWQAVVRETVNVAGDRLLEQDLPGGIKHHYLLLGKIEDGSFIPDESGLCKSLGFPPLTDIQAADVCYDNSHCDHLAHADTVQEAIDALCQGRDLRWHNKHLHGWGIVCGLIARCGPDTLLDEQGEAQRRQVRITPGYAIDCEGEDIVLDNERILDVMARIEAMQERGIRVLEEGKGTVCLRLDRGEDGQPKVRVVPYTEANADSSMLDGTLLMDFVQHCILDLVQAVMAEFQFLDQDELDELEGGTTGLVSKERMKFTSLLNLVIQLINHENGAYVFLSRKEHLILRDFYLALRELLQSKTFCAMFQDQSFPEYPFKDTGMATVFGKNLHTRIVLHPSGERVYSYGGTDNSINVYDLKEQALVQVVEMPAAEGAEVTALSFSADGRLLYAAASVRGVDTVFGIARVGKEHKWEQMTILCNMEILEMQLSTEDRGLLYATVRGRGLFFLRPDLLMDQEKPQPEPVYAFNASGHLAIDVQTQIAYCTAMDENAEPDVYDRIVVCPLRVDPEQSPDALEVSLADDTGKALVGSDGLAIRSGERAFLYVMSDAVAQSADKRLLTYKLPLTAQSRPQAILEVENTGVALCYHPQAEQLLLAMEDGYRLQAVQPSGNKTSHFRIPVQIQPTDLLLAPQSNQVVALNYVSNTLSLVPTSELAVNEAFLKQLADYRMAVLQSFYGLVGGLFQYLKDCFCDHLLVKCPSCEDGDVIYLASVEIRDNKVYNICNFDKRKYVKSFPTMGYWLSIIPVWPLLKEAVGKLCCAVLPNWFDKQRDRVIRESTSAPTVKPARANALKAGYTRKGIQTYQRTDTNALIRSQFQGARFMGQLATDKAVSVADSGRRKDLGVRKQSLMQAEVNDAVSTLNKNQIQVQGIKKYDAHEADRYLSAFTSTPQRIPPGSKVTLYQKDGKVAFYALEKAEAGRVELSESDRQKLAEMEARKQKLSDMSAVNAELAKAETRRKELGKLEAVRKDIDSLRAEKLAMEEELAAIQSQVKTVQSARKALAEELTQTHQSLDSLRQMHKDIQLEVTKTRPVKELAAVTPALDTALREANIRSIGELAALTPGKLSRREGISSAQAKTLVSQAKARLKG
ncbi:DUF6519 domain-containing protein [Aliiglaciecola sp. CAU 1673]|uniref:DUF6519 domain-containing protein n=1 Tax=Aliiglaciecola sp. CAU 1673 TaxID=3032595 RepID=UPI0023D98DE0|nr:DUF6519 domain-containing protein [Aliiglaciecola sp. CAU 1673]MDF2177360.1 DUF6519 domain-containing protein [Aliiglaciecola sp. CAU 1673]